MTRSNLEAIKRDKQAMPIMLYCNWTVKPCITWMVENAVGLQAFQGQAIINQVPQPPSISTHSSHATGVWFSIDPVIMQMEIWNQYLVPTIMLRGGNIINYDAAYLCQWSSILGSVFYFLYRVPMTHCKDINILHHLLTNLESLPMNTAFLKSWTWVSIH